MSQQSQPGGNFEQDKEKICSYSNGIYQRVLKNCRRWGGPLMESGKGHLIVEEGAEGVIGTGHSFCFSFSRETITDVTNQSKSCVSPALGGRLLEWGPGSDGQF